MELPELKIGMSAGLHRTILCTNENDATNTAIAYTVVRRRCAKHFADAESIAAELARRSNLFPRLVEALEDCLSDADALLSASDGDYARPDEGLVANGKTILAEIRQSEQEGGEHDSD